MRIAIYLGSFDPITKGHLDVLHKASLLFDKVIIAVLQNDAKKGFLPTADRVALIKESVKDYENVEVDSFDGLTIEYAKAKGSNVLIRGLRAVSDFEYEFQMALANRKLNPELDTVFLMTSAEYMYLSSSIVKDIAVHGGGVADFVPEGIMQDIVRRIRKGE